MNRVSMLLACAAMLFAVQPALAIDDVAAELDEMRSLVEGLQEKVEAQEEQIEHQGELLEQAQEVVRTRTEQGSKSGISAFLDYVSVGGHLAGSYFYDFARPEGTFGGAGINNGQIGTMPFHPDHNSFTVDQIWFSLSKEATEESRGGFAFDMFYGNAANFYGTGTGQALQIFATENGRFNGVAFEDSIPTSRRATASDATSDFIIVNAYAEYQCDCFGPEVNFKFGKMQTLVGAEVVQTNQNWNITRGNVYTFLQPLDNLGLRASFDIGDLANVTLGIFNDASSFNSAVDINSGKGYEASVFVGDDKMSLRTSFLWGPDFGVYDANTYFANGTTLAFTGATTLPNGTVIPAQTSQPNINSVNTGVLDITGFYNPSETLSTWVNYSYKYIQGSASFGHGVALAGRAQITETIGAALRGEYVRLVGDGEIQDIYASGVAPNNQEIYSVTATGDVALTEHLTAKAEYRFDFVKQRPRGTGFYENSRGFSDNRSVAGVEVIYTY